LFGLEQSQTSKNAEFSVNNISFIRQTNSGLKDVVAGLTINLAPDAESADGPRTVSIVINKEHSSASSAIQGFLDKFNDVQNYIATKTAITKTGDNTYTRGTLADDSTFNDLRDRLFEVTMTQSSSNSSFHSLRDLGITLGDDMKISIEDSGKLEDALTSHYEDATSLLSEVMQKMQSELKNYTGSDGYMPTVIKGFDSQTNDLNYSITQMEQHLSERKDQLIEQYGQMQSLLLSMSYQQQTLTSMFGSMNNLYA
jgi:flagellar hook-associated protein 2